MPVSKKRKGRGNGTAKRTGNPANRPKGSPATGSSQGAAIYHEMKADEDFETTADMIFQMVRDTARKFPGKPRHLYLDIEGHRNGAGGFDHDAYELQKEFLMGFLSPYLTSIRTPLYHAESPAGAVQRDDLPHVLNILPEVGTENHDEKIRERAKAHGVPIYDADTGKMVGPDGPIADGSSPDEE